MADRDDLFNALLAAEQRLRVRVSEATEWPGQLFRFTAEDERAFRLGADALNKEAAALVALSEVAMAQRIEALETAPTPETGETRKEVMEP